MSEERGTRDGNTAGITDPRDGRTATDATPGVSSPSSRPSGKRSGRRSPDSPRAAAGSGRSATAVATKAPAGKSGAKKPENIFKRLRRFFREVIA
ncbi:preprotein translocase subunit SecE, partial [Rhodococcus sp. CX]|uniref:preprotein translocase subunit SecE n=1 Tax=Rhodococcus sp. CX TaxID=2789880 RepID=UPI0027DB4D01